MSRQVEAELATTQGETETATRVDVATAKSSTASKVAQVTNIVAKQVEALTQSPAAKPAHRPLRSRAGPPRERAITVEREVAGGTSAGSPP